jgi:threonine/homoserine/homoserine lactone efflux protein
LFHLLLSGTTFGLAAGLSPGPVLALVVSQTLRYGLREGLKVSLAPLVTDLPIVSFCLFVLSRVSHTGLVLAWISIAGGVYVAWLGIDSLRMRMENTSSTPLPKSFWKAVAINFLNPHVYLFWLTVGAPTVLRAANDGMAFAALFAAPFYVCLCGSKMLVAVLVHRSRSFLHGDGYRWSLRAVGGALVLFGLWLVRDGLVALE